MEEGAQPDEPCPRRLPLCSAGPQSGQAPGTGLRIRLMKNLSNINKYILQSIQNMDW